MDEVQAARPGGDDMRGSEIAWVRRIRGAVWVSVPLAALAMYAAAPPPIERFLEAASADERVAKAALDDLAASWKDSYTAMIIDLARMMRPPRRAADTPFEPVLTVDDERDATSAAPPTEIALPDAGSPARRRLIAFLERQTKQSFGHDLTRWRTWMWKLPYDPHPDYAALKARVYGRIDPRMREFCPAGVRAAIRLDEIDWGGVTVNGIPPLRYPSVVPARDARYLKDSNVVFGLVSNGEARAYPKRILGWHELASDRLGGVEFTIVYCTLCGTVIPFESQAGGRLLHLGTSGLLYRSNKLLFDEETNSLWSTFEGVPVVGSLVGSGMTLRSHPVVTTTWKEWRTDHPATTVLSIDTGYKRDYSEGAAYREYFASDRLMFGVSATDPRLRNKAEVLVMRLQGETASGKRRPVAIDVQFLRKHPVYTVTAAPDPLVVVTSSQGASRVYRTEAIFPEQPAREVLVDRDGRRWRVTEAALVPEGPGGGQAPRVSAQRAFWFGWYAQFPDTILIK